MGGPSGPSAVYDGNDWVDVPFASGAPVVDVWVADVGVAIAAAWDDTIERLSGGQWAVDRPPAGIYRFLAAYGTSPDDVFVVGERGRVYHYDGAAWSPIDVGHNDNIEDVWVDQRNILMVDDGGNIRRLVRVGGT